MCTDKSSPRRGHLNSLSAPSPRPSASLFLCDVVIPGQSPASVTWRETALLPLGVGLTSSPASRVRVSELPNLLGSCSIDLFV